MFLLCYRISKGMGVSPALQTPSRALAQGCEGLGWADTVSAGRGAPRSCTHGSLLLSLGSGATSAKTPLLLWQEFSTSTTVPVSLVSKVVTLFVSHQSLWIKGSSGIRRSFQQQRCLKIAEGKGFSICFVSLPAQKVSRHTHGYYLLDEFKAFESDPGLLWDFRYHLQC